MKILDAERETTIKDAIHQELARALHNEELDIQQSQISITLGQQITMALRIICITSPLAKISGLIRPTGPLSMTHPSPWQS
jgi:hypothetical protein